MKSLVFAEQFYYPEGWGGAQLPRDLTTHLARSGMGVEVICSGDSYVTIGDEQVHDPRLDGVVIRRTPRLIGGTIHRFKLLKQFIFYAACAPLLFFRRSPDLFVTQTNPPLLVPLIAMAALVHRRPFIIIAQDIYPEVMFAHGMANSRTVVGRLLRCLFSWAYGRAAKVVALGDVMAQRLIQKGVQSKRIEVISNWATGDEAIERGPDNSLRHEWDLTGRFVILYSGNIGIAHDVETPVAALRILLARSLDVRLVFIGKGSRLVDAQRAAAAAGVEHAVLFRALVPAACLPQSLGLAHVALVTLREGFEGLVVPSKLLGYMARAVPTVYVGPRSDVEQMLFESGGGLCVRNGDAEAMAREIQALIDCPARLNEMGAAAESYYQHHLCRDRGLQKYVDLIDSLTAESIRLSDARG